MDCGRCSIYGRFRDFRMRGRKVFVLIRVKIVDYLKGSVVWRRRGIIGSVFLKYEDVLGKFCLFYVLEMLRMFYCWFF